MSTVKIKSTEVVRRFADIKAFIQDTGAKVVVEEYKRPVLVIYPSDEAGDPIMPELPKDMKEMEQLRERLKKKRIKVSAVNFT